MTVATLSLCQSLMVLSPYSSPGMATWVAKDSLSGAEAQHLYESMQLPKVLEELKLSTAVRKRLEEAIEQDLRSTANAVTAPVTWCSVLRERAVAAMAAQRAGQKAVVVRERKCCCGRKASECDTSAQK